MGKKRLRIAELTEENESLKYDLNLRDKIIVGLNHKIRCLGIALNHEKQSRDLLIRELSEARQADT